ncbi:MAG: ABC transporter ATP-binding protein, partial [Bacteroidales bacterium]|nr:ABC transporter ATP-binding protein [Bacteroidales bacterium]
CILVHQPDLLMIDEVFSVGDKGFQIKCVKRLHEIIENGATLLFVSHNPDDMKKICKRGICLKEGVLIYDGDVDSATNVYNDMFKNPY